MDGGNKRTENIRTRVGVANISENMIEVSLKCLEYVERKMKTF